MPGTRTKTNVGIIILAAGSSNRLGMPKQLFHFGGESLLDHTIKVAVEANASLVVVVLGDNADAIQNQIHSKSAHTVINNNYPQGMSSSIRCGLNEMLNLSPAITSALIMLCDQPFVNTSLLNDLINAHTKTGKPVVACTYAKTFGPPALFHKDLFPELMQLEGDNGARKVILKHTEEVLTIPFQNGEIDIDTKDDVLKLEERRKKNKI